MTLKHASSIVEASTARFEEDSADAHKAAIKQEVYALLRHAGKENWDSGGAVALDQQTVDIAQRLVDRFPSWLERPEVTATPHGEVDFDWLVRRDVMLTISVSPSKHIAFAGLFHSTRVNGRELWVGILPQFVNCCFERLREFYSL